MEIIETCYHTIDQENKRRYGPSCAVIKDTGRQKHITLQSALNDQLETAMVLTVLWLGDSRFSRLGTETPRLSG